MRDESEIFKEWYEKGCPNELPPDSLEYIALRDTINFQSYLLQAKAKDFTEEIKKASNVYKVLKELVDKTAGRKKQKGERKS